MEDMRVGGAELPQSSIIQNLTLTHCITAVYLSSNTHTGSPSLLFQPFSSLHLKVLPHGSYFSIQGQLLLVP